MAVKRFADAMSHITKQHPDAKAKDIERWGWTHLDIAVAEESIRKALNGRIDPTACAVELLMLLSSYFEVQPSALGPDAERRLISVLAYAGLHLDDDPGGLEVSHRAWNGDATIITMPTRHLAAAA